MSNLVRTVDEAAELLPVACWSLCNPIRPNVTTEAA
jgi:hypothetical protein